MLTKDIILKTLNSYNLNSHKYGPTIYENSNLGICLDIKDSIFGYLTRAFIFNEPNSLEEFIQKYLWYKNNYQKYPIKLVLTDYNHPETTIKYIYQEKELTLNEMQNLKENISLKKEDTKNNNLKTAYLLNIEALTNYLINLKNEHNNLKIEKNNLKIKENDLKYALLENLTIYYGKTRPIEKKGVSLDNIINSNSENTLLQNNLTNIKNKELPAIEDYLKVLINLVKEEELNNQSLINTYSNNIYKYNISILNKQIEFVKSKIEAEKNFNLKGSKIHNIDDELKSFLKNSPTPLKVNEYIEENQTKIKAKYQDLTNLSLAYTKITGNPLNIPEIIDEKITELAPSYNNLPLDIKNSLILFNSFYKPICNYIIENNYPSLENIKSNFDFTYYYEELLDIFQNENNNHYFIKYFKPLNFKTLDTFINSLITITKTFESTSLFSSLPLTAFAIPKNHTYQELTTKAFYSNDAYIINIPANTNLIYIPEKLEIDEETKEITLTKSSNIYYKGSIIPTNETITVNKYHKVNKNENNTLITTNLELDTTTTFTKGTLKEASHE